MRVRYFIKKQKTDYVSIFLRFWDSNRTDLTARTGLVTKFDDWSTLKQKVKPKADAKQKDFINNNLKELETFIIEKYNIDFNSRKPITKNWLKDNIENFFGRTKKDELHKAYFVEWIKDFLLTAENRIYKGNKITKSTKDNYTKVYNRLVEFETSTNSKLRFEDIDLKFYTAFVNYCKDVKKYSNNTIGNLITRIKFFCRQIELENLPINPQFKHSEFMAISNKTFDIYLTETEINKIYNHDFSKSLRLDNARDLFIIGLRTGLRVSDFLQLKNIDINKGFIEIETTKTKETVIIPLHPQVKAIIEKNDNKLPRTISDQRFNLYIKEICKDAGITETVKGAIVNPETNRKEVGRYEKYKLVSSHTCRRSFASNLYGNLPNMVIMSITGHKTETSFLKYIKITKKENAETLKRYWANQQKENEYTTVLRAVK
jgi:integrase